MGKLKSKMKATTLRKIFQVFFLALSIFYLLAFVPNNKLFLITILLIILITVVFRTGFCGWLCPLGTIFDFIRIIGKKIGGFPFIRPINKKYKAWVNNNKNFLNKIDKYGRYFKYIFLIWMMQAAFIAEGDQHNEVISTLIFLFLIIIGLFVDRAFCKYLCPFGATLGLTGKLSPTKLTRNENLCIDCNLCTKICPMNIDVAQKKNVNNSDCNTCLVCVDVCPVNGALDLNIILPLPTKYQSSTTKKSAKLMMKKVKIPKFIYAFIVVCLLTLGLIIINIFVV